MAPLSHTQKLARNELALMIRERRPEISYLDALGEAAETVRRGGQAAAGPSVAEVQRLVAKATRKAVRARVREALTAAGAPLLAATAAFATGDQSPFWAGAGND
jgi:hypothetical protein